MTARPCVHGPPAQPHRWPSKARGVGPDLPGAAAPQAFRRHSGDADGEGRDQRENPPRGAERGPQELLTAPSTLGHQSILRDFTFSDFQTQAGH